MSEAAVAAPAATNTPSAGNSAPNSPPSNSTPNPSSSVPANTSGGAPANTAPEIFEVKVNGKTLKMTRQEVLDHASMSHAANEKFNEAKKLRLEYEAKQKNYKQNRIQSFLDATEDLTPEQRREEIEKYYAEHYIEQDKLSPAEKALREREAKVKQWEEEQKAKTEKEVQDAAKSADEKMTSQQREYLQNQIIEALEKSNLPKTKQTVSRMAFYMRQNHSNGWDAPMDMVIRQVQNERKTHLQSEVQTSSFEQILDLFGEEFINKIRQADLKRLRERRNLPPVNAERTASAPYDPNEKISYTEVNRRLRDIRTGKI